MKGVVTDLLRGTCMSSAETGFITGGVLVYCRGEEYTVEGRNGEIFKILGIHQGCWNLGLCGCGFCGISGTFTKTTQNKTNSHYVHRGHLTCRFSSNKGEFVPIEITSLK